MAKFVYRMQNILDIKNKLEVQARNSYAAARMKLSQEEEKLDRMFEQKKLTKKIIDNSYPEISIYYRLIYVRMPLSCARIR